MMKSEMDKLEEYLSEKGISYKRQIGVNSDQIVVYNARGRRQWDAVCNPMSYGYDDGLLEIMGSPVVKEKDRGDIVGWLTADEVIARFESGSVQKAANAG